MRRWWRQCLGGGLLVLCQPGWAAPDWRFVVTPNALEEEVELAVKDWREPPKREDDLPSVSAGEPVPVDDEQLVREATYAVAQTLQALGYYEPDISLVRRDGDWRLTVNAGEPVRVRQLGIELQGAAADDKWFRAPAFPMASGDVLHQGHYEEYKQQVSDLTLERGYLDARWVANDIAVDLQARTADITLRHDSGPRYRFGEIRFLDIDGQPLTGLDERWLDSLTPFKPGDDVTSQRIFQFQKNLLESRYFADVRVNMLRDQADGLSIPVEVRADRRQPNKMSLGLGYATDVGPRVSLEWQRHLLNHRGHGIEATTEVSQVRQQGEVRYKVPWKHPIEDTLQFLFGVQHDLIDDTDTTQVVVGVQRVIQPQRGWQRTYGLKLSEEFYRRDSGDKGQQQLLVPSVSFSRLVSRGGLDPVSGFRQTYQIEGAHPELLSDADYVLLRTGLRWLDTFAERHMLLARLDAGIILSPGFDDVPPSVRFYAGGDNSVRGYDYRSLAPRNANNEVVGGRYLLAGSLEYAWRWLPSWRPAAFIDVGNAFDEIGDPLKIGAGVGIRWISPVGPVRLDLASALSEDGNPLRLHLTLGAPL